ncbi:hypothetical protein WDU94_008403 [Cyamophila willieti]
MKSHYRGHKMAVWLNLIPQLHQPGDDDVSMRHHHFHERANHYYAGVVKPESFTKLPPLLTTTKLNIECEPNSTLPNENSLLDKTIDHKTGDDDSEESLLERIARKNYSYTTALGVTVGIGCLLLILNIVIFTAIYYQRRRKKKARDRDAKDNEISSDMNPSSGDNYDTFSLTQLSINDKSVSFGIGLNSSGTILTKSPSIPEPPPPPKSMPPPPLVVVPPPKLPPNKLNSCLSNSSSNVNAVKKRVQIQEISV